MSTGITFWCDVSNEWGSCPQEISIQTTDLEHARACATARGWQLSDTGDRCAHYHAPKQAPTNLRRIR